MHVSLTRHFQELLLLVVQKMLGVVHPGERWGSAEERLRNLQGLLVSECNLLGLVPDHGGKVVDNRVRSHKFGLVGVF